MPESQKVLAKVLLVDDDSLVLKSVAGVIENAGFAVETASRGKEAIEKFTSSPPNVMVIDAIMPEMNGFEVMRKIRTNEAWKKIPIIVLTGLKAPDDATLARSAGASDVLVKPVDGATIVKRIKYHLFEKQKQL